MFEAKRVAERVDTFFERSREQRAIIGRFVVVLGPQTKGRDDGDPIGFARVAEDVVMRRLVEVAGHDTEQQAVLARKSREHAIENRVEKELASRRVRLGKREGERLFDCELVEKSLLQAWGEPFAEVGADAVHGDETYFFHLEIPILHALRSSPPMRASACIREL